MVALIPALPLAAFLAIGLSGSWLRGRGHYVGVPAVLLSLVLSLLTLWRVGQGLRVDDELYVWIVSGDFRVAIGWLIDPLTAVMLVLVTTVSSLVHVYSMGYMRGDSGYDRFFAYLGLFTFSMLMLVLSNNLLQLYIFWEAVGLCSYLLIAHWYERKSACDAATKAFVVNRVGDFGFGLGILLIFLLFGAVDYASVFAAAPEMASATVNLLAPLTWLGWEAARWDVGALTVICLLLFTGAVGKSAQLPLHTWLPDAMEGPTPISALIHAATMVTAGVFMVARMSPLFDLSPAALTVVALVGGATALFAATIALTQTDIKRIVAYSTVSQLGYMFMAAGVGAYAAGMYHLLTHGAFKALLFLGCGSVIIALHHEQDIRRMGGLKDALPVTHWTMLIGSLALAGFPLTAGFFSKDEILLSAWSAGPLGQLLALTGLATAFLTAFYSFRLLFIVFWGASRVDPKQADHIHEPPVTMTAPLLILAVLSVITGYIGIPGFLAPGETAPHEGQTGIVAAAILAGLGGIAAAYVLYVQSPELPRRLAEQWRTLYALSLNKWYVDELYDRLIVRPTVRLAHALWRHMDVRVIDGAVNGVAALLSQWAGQARRMQSGQLQHYALVMTVGLFLLVSMYFFW
ncbi:MAG: NADH-quinone oxidoreductase subunit L [Nitrospirota bacterium]